MEPQNNMEPSTGSGSGKSTMWVIVVVVLLVVLGWWYANRSVDAPEVENTDITITDVDVDDALPAGSGADLSAEDAVAQ